MMKASDLRDKSVDELHAILQETRNELFVDLNALRQAKKPDVASKIKLLRKDIARLLTVIRQKDLAVNKS